MSQRPQTQTVPLPTALPPPGTLRPPRMRLQMPPPALLTLIPAWVRPLTQTSRLARPRTRQQATLTLRRPMRLPSLTNQWVRPPTPTLTLRLARPVIHPQWSLTPRPRPARPPSRRPPPRTLCPRPTRPQTPRPAL